MNDEVLLSRRMSWLDRTKREEHPLSSIRLKEVLEKAACRISDCEDLVYGELDSAMGGVTRLLLEAMAESEVERRCWGWTARAR